MQFRIVRVKLRKFFGEHVQTIRGAPAQVTDREKAIIDCLDRPDLTSGISTLDPSSPRRAHRIATHRRIEVKLPEDGLGGAGRSGSQKFAVSPGRQASSFGSWSWTTSWGGRCGQSPASPSISSSRAGPAYGSATSLRTDSRRTSTSMRRDGPGGKPSNTRFAKRSKLRGHIDECKAFKELPKKLAARGMGQAGPGPEHLIVRVSPTICP